MKFARKMQRILDLMVTRSIRMDILRASSTAERQPRSDSAPPDSTASK
jgi:hypothetical protein